MMRSKVVIVACLALAPAAGAEEGSVKPVACEPGLAIVAQKLQARLDGFRRPGKDAGTVHPRATVAVLESNGLKLAVAIDAAKADAKTLDVIRFDFTGTGQFAGKPALPLNVRRADKDGFIAMFGPGTVLARRGGPSRASGPNGTGVPVRVQGEYRAYGDRYKRLTLELGAALEGRCRFGRRALAVRVVDGNCNLTFGDKAVLDADGERVRGLTSHDTLAVDTADGSFGPEVVKAYYGHPVRVDGAWYEVTLSPDGKKVTARPSTAKTATLKVAHTRWSAKLAGKTHVLNLQGSAEPMPIPADRYLVLEYRELAPAGKEGKPGSLTSKWGGPRGGGATCWVDAAAGTTVQPVLGTPLTARIAAKADGRVVKMNMTLVDAAGMTVEEVSLPGVFRPAAAFDILDAAGKRVHGGKFAFG